MSGITSLQVGSPLSYLIAFGLPCLDAVLPVVPSETVIMGLIIVCRFIPGGRTAVTLCCGLMRYPWRRFALAVVIAAVIWAGYAFLAGRIGGLAFEHQPVLGFVVAFGGALVLSGIIELVRRLVQRRGRQGPGENRDPAEKGGRPADPPGN